MGYMLYNLLYAHYTYKCHYYEGNPLASDKSRVECQSNHRPPPSSPLSPPSTPPSSTSLSGLLSSIPWPLLLSSCTVQRKDEMRGKS